MYEKRVVNPSLELFDTCFSFLAEPGKIGFPASEVCMNFFCDWSKNEKRPLKSFTATRLVIPKYHEVVHLDSLEEHMISSVPHRGNMPGHCFWLYGMTGTRERLAAVRRSEKRNRVAQQDAALEINNENTDDAEIHID
ncbi:hypothetical protein Dimus_005465, partial [Dionaea muscipula]